jgi:hypothetical protein
LLLSTKGSFWFENIKCGCYRVHSSGLSKKGNSNARAKFNRTNIDLLEKFNEFSQYKFKKIIKKEISIQAKNLFYFSKDQSDRIYYKYLNTTDKLKVILYKLLNN